MEKLFTNCSFDGTNLQSYSTIVAKKENDKLVVLGWWSVTTTKHINKAAKVLGLDIVKLK
jgi:hypothetical protein